MRVLVLQLSDVHFRASDNMILSRVDAIKRAVQGADPRFDACLIAMTGDVAWSGQPQEYKAAHAFFDQLHKALVSICPGLQVEEVFIPGNHDCVLPDNKISSRRLIVDHLAKNPPTFDQHDDALIQDCLEVQNSFFQFLAERPSGAKYPLANVIPDCLYYPIDVIVADRRIRFCCYNSAWMSQRHEQPGQLLAPTWITPETNTPADLIITLFHHPYNWYDPINAKEFRRQVERSSDLVMTGHEHVSEQYSKQTIRGEKNEYFEGAVLQGHPAEGSGFNIVVIDLDRHECRVALYGWQDDYYAAQEEGEWRLFGRGNRHNSRPFEPTETFAAKLADAGVAFTHPRKTILRLPDIFVYPDLQDQPQAKEKSDRALLKTIRGDMIHGYIRAHQKVFIMGDERCGRTSLAKTLYGDFLRQGQVPVFVSGDQLKNHDEEALVKVVSQCIQLQYGYDMVERFWQLDAAKRVLLIDDLHRCRLNRKGLNAVLDNACQLFGNIVLLANDLFQIEEIAYPADEQAILLSFRRCTVQPFGHRLRRQIIEKWFSLGQEYTTNETDIAEQIRNAENLVNTLLGKNLLPFYPLFVLTMLQSYEASAHHNTALGAYGYHYEALITAALAQSIQGAKSRIMVGTIYTFVSGVAYHLFQQKKKSYAPAEMEQVIDQYKAFYGMRFSNDEMLSVLEEARILYKEFDGRYTFPYLYIYYYFVARYINDNLRTSTQEEALRKRVVEMTQKLYVEEYANIIIFLVYLTKDERIISDILSHAQTLYAGYEPCDLDTHLSFASHLTGKPLPLHLDDGNLREHNQEIRDKMDEADRLALLVADGDEETRERESQELDNVSQMNAALKTLEVMGQILRNFPGSLPGDLKLKIANESYMLGLRTLRALYTLMDEHLEELRLFFSEVIEHFRQIKDTDELAKATDDFLYALIFGASYGLIKRVSQAVGSEQLEETYKQIADPRSPISVALIDLSIKLDHFRQFPLEEIERIKELASKNPFATSLLRCFVRDHLYLYPVNYQTRQLVCAKLDIAANDPKMLVPNDKRIKKK